MEIDSTEPAEVGLANASRGPFDNANVWAPLRTLFRTPLAASKLAFRPSDINRISPAAVSTLGASSFVLPCFLWMIPGNGQTQFHSSCLSGPNATTASASASRQLAGNGTDSSPERCGGTAGDGALPSAIVCGGVFSSAWPG